MSPTRTTRPVRLRVLIAEDHPHVRREMTRLLDTHFDVVGAVEDGQGLVDAEPLLQPNVIVSDIRMPRLSGLDAMRELRAIGRNVPFVLVSMDGSCAGYWIEQGAAAFVHKDDMCCELVPAINSAATG